MSITVTNLAIGVSQIQVAGVDIGATEGEAIVRRTVDWYEFDCAQTTARPLLMVPQAVSMQVELTLAEVTLSRLVSAWSIPTAQLGSSGAYSSIILTNAADTTVVVQIKAIGPNSKVWTWLFSTCQGLSTGQIAHSRTGKTVVTAMFQVIPSLSTAAQPVGTFGTVTEAAA